MNIPVVRGFDALIINGVHCEAVRQCSFDLDTKEFVVNLESPKNLLSLGVTGDRPDITALVKGVEGKQLLFMLSNDYQFMNTNIIAGKDFTFDIVNYVGAECTT